MRKLLCFIGLLFGYTLTHAQIQTGVFRTPTGNIDYHQFTRTGGGAAVFIHQTDSINPILRLASKTANAGAGLVFTVENNGNTGIGTIKPDSRLTVAGGGISLFSALTNGVARPAVSAGTIPGEIRGMSASGATLDDGFLRLSAGGGTTISAKSFIDLSGYTAASAIERSENITMGTKGVERLRITNAGYVGIGTTAPKERLSVNGNIQAKEIKVTTAAADWPDYVFKRDYSLTPLLALEQQIQTLGHLPDMPAAAEVEKQGVSLGVINRALVKKVEELTLHAIHQEKRLETQDEQLQALLRRLEALEVANTKASKAPDRSKESKHPKQK